MKISSAQINNFLEEGFKHYQGALIFGNNSELIFERSRALQSQLINSSRVTLEYKQCLKDPSILDQELKVTGLFSSSKIITIENVTHTISPKLVQILNTTTEDFLIFRASELPPSSGTRKFFENHPKFAVIASYQDDNGNITRSIIHGDLQKFIKDFQQLCDLGISVMGTLRNITHYFVRLLKVKTLIDQGHPEAAAIATLLPPIFYKQEEDFKKGLRKYSIPILLEVVEQLIMLEKDCKSCSTHPKILCDQKLISIIMYANGPDKKHLQTL